MVRVPMIRFRYGVRDAPVAAAAAAAVPSGPVYIKRSELPERFRMKPLSEADMIRIQFGGAEDYELKKKVRR